ncbi:MAG: UvrD-helicase domain-containing protein [Simkaniaceae bacterium]|nr:UvrD-helicase domain-containing protein [Simkaniaceae bacterium]
MHLNSEQQQAVHHTLGPLLILAGAGSGKTRIVTARIIYLLSQGVDPSQILAVTFTNKAAQEMKDRVRRMTDAHVLTCTFHSLSARILREAIHFLGYRRDFTIYDETDSEKLLKTCLNALNYSEKKDLKRIKHAISKAKNDLLEPDEPDVKPLYILYQEKLKEYNALDFDDLIFLTVKLFKEHPEVLKVYSERWHYILVDEYQDTNAAQYTLTKLLAGKRCNLCVVGDPDQSIYSWRGADIHNILNFEKDYPGTRVIKLEQNYRSTNQILGASNAVIAHNEERYQKDLWSSLGEGDPIHLFYCSNERQEADWVVNTLTSLQRRQKILLSDMVIFYRTNAQSRVFEDTLLKYGIPYVIVGGISFYQRKEIKDILCYLRLLVSPSDFLSFERTINLPKRGIGGATIDRLREEAEKSHRPILEVIRDPQSVKLSTKQRDSLINFASLIERLRNLSLKKGAVSDLIKEVIESSHYLDVLKSDPDTYEDRRENLDQLIAKGTESEDLLLFLEELSLKSSLDEVKEGTDALKLMTVHNSKGLEFEVVFIVGLEEELFPHVNSLENVEEERRLFYVGMTRARHHLFLSGTYYRVMWGTPRVMQPSRFLHEIPKRFIQVDE